MSIKMYKQTKGTASNFAPWEAGLSALAANPAKLNFGGPKNLT
jgi:hypothetical protein